ncbi:MAG: hypothetical protein JWN79_3429, partial [Gemmatimonadetes bacterium]|nr:hypothetical protein [Gemmatimonadota bacterium]
MPANSPRLSRALRSSAGIIGAVLALLVVLLLVLPLVFRDRISARLKAEIANALDARVAWSDASLSVLRNFPNVTLSLDRLSVV